MTWRALSSQAHLLGSHPRPRLIPRLDRAGHAGRSLGVQRADECLPRLIDGPGLTCGGRADQRAFRRHPQVKQPRGRPVSCGRLEANVLGEVPALEPGRHCPPRHQARLLNSRSLTHMAYYDMAGDICQTLPGPRAAG
jgi:hypothetical protein